MIETKLKTSEVLDLAADAIKQAGWSVGYGWFPTEQSPKLCLEGGLIAAMGLTADDLDLDDSYQWAEFQACPAYVAMKNYLGRDGSLWSWNDRQDDQSKVIDALRGAAEAEREKESK